MHVSERMQRWIAWSCKCYVLSTPLLHILFYMIIWNKKYWDSAWDVCMLDPYLSDRLHLLVCVKVSQHGCRNTCIFVCVWYTICHGVYRLQNVLFVSNTHFTPLFSAATWSVWLRSSKQKGPNYGDIFSCAQSRQPTLPANCKLLLHHQWDSCHRHQFRQCLSYWQWQCMLKSFYLLFRKSVPWLFQWKRFCLFVFDIPLWKQGMIT